MDIKEMVRDTRERLGIKRKKFAGMMNVNESCIWRWENGQRTPDGPALILLSLIRKLHQMD